MDPINVLSDPHESNPNPEPESAGAAGKLQQLLGKAPATEGAAGGTTSSSNEHSPESIDEVRSVHSATSLRFAKGIVIGLFGRGKRCASDGMDTYTPFPNLGYRITRILTLFSRSF
jgi:hypothetical protein